MIRRAAYREGSNIFQTLNMRTKLKIDNNGTTYFIDDHAVPLKIILKG